MKKLFLIIIITILCTQCGKKSSPEYKAQEHINKTIYII